MRMRIKNFTLVFLMGIFGLFTTNLFAQEDATIAPENIRYWIGEGQNEAIFIANWAEPDTALAWGYRFDAETVTIKTIMDDIAAVDPRFSYEATESGWLLDMHFNDGVLNLSLVEQMWISFLINGLSSWDTYDVATVAPGEYVKLGDTHCGTLVDPASYIYVWEKEVAAVYPYAEEAMISPDDILMWVGEGDSQAIFAVNWAEPNVCYAWGFRFPATNGITVKDMMDAIAEADYRFDYQGDGGMVYEINYNDGEQNLGLVGLYWMYNINGGMAWNGYDEQIIEDNDFVKFGDIACATEIAQWTYVWTAPVIPVEGHADVVENETSINLYPNPASSYTMLNMQEMTEAVVTVSDLQGRVLNSFTVAQTNEPVRIETAGYQAGIYFVTVSDATSRQTLKLTVR